MGTTTKAIVSMAAVSVMAWGGTSAKAQEPFKTRLSVDFAFTPEWQVDQSRGEDKSFYPTYGVFLEAQFTRRSGLQFGIYDRMSDMTGWIPGPPPGAPNVIHAVSLRLGYKFYWAKGIDLAAGMLYDAGVGKYAPSDAYGPYFSISKDIRLYKELFAELEAHANPFFNPNHWGSGSAYRGIYVGVGLKVKYRF